MGNVFYLAMRVNSKIQLPKYVQHVPTHAKNVKRAQQIVLNANLQIIFYIPLKKDVSI